MDKYQVIYDEKLMSAEKIAGYIESGFVCASPIGIGEPTTIIKAIGERARRGEITNVEHHSNLSMSGNASLNPDISHNFHHVAWFSSGHARNAIWEGRADFMPSHYSDMPALWQLMPKVDVFYAVVSKMDKHGYFSLSLSLGTGLAQLRRARYVFLEVNENAPRTFGENAIHVSDITGLCESKEPIAELIAPEMTTKDKQIAEYVVERIPDGATIQFGIGGVPNAVGKMLIDKKGLGIHTEMFSDSMIDLIYAGAVTNENKEIHRGKSIGTFFYGTKRLYDFMDDNPSVEVLPVDYVNNPYTIARHKNFISINAAIEVDFLGQVCSESIGSKHFSGTGGQSDYVRGAVMSEGGKSFIAMYSTAKNDTISKIGPTLTAGATVSTHKNDIDYMVTEYGAVKLRGKTAGQRARALISIAHPKFREELLFEAKKMNLMI